MRMTLLLHIVAGGVGLITGFVALYAAKGRNLHRKSGIVFVYAMLIMCAGGFLVSAIRGVAPAINVPASLVTACLVVTGLTTVRPPSKAAQRADIAAMVVAWAVGLTSLGFALDIMSSGRSGGGAAFAYVLFGVSGVVAGAGDVRVMRSGPRQGASRLARHLWRMCFALFIASLSFFIGQAQVIPEPLRIRPLLALPVLAVLVTMLYWLWRVRFRRNVRGLTITAANAA
ncbi:MAG TPA: hypothetical protein VFT12_10460 [Thermoanaerobaculia bacterium]|nr:hypothetical protein [Thermoanaerobaculia bacterium]